MPELKIDQIGLKVGLEIHQQLDTNKKLFCKCAPKESDEFTSKFTRKLRISKSELGQYDPAALFESTKSKTMLYFTNPVSSCLVEMDEEPPHDLDGDAKEIVLTIACALESKIFSEIYVMRKTVIDGSNTSGFQRTMLVSQGGHLDVEGQKIGVQSICLEEDAAKLLNDKGSIREYSLDRLGIPLIEIALEPVQGPPAKIRKIALSLGRLLRTTKKVSRGLGSIRQDVNVSIKDGQVVEVKGVQQLDQLEKVIEYEAKRQQGLLLISEKLKNLDLEVLPKDDVFDVSFVFENSKSTIIQKALKTNSQIKAVRIKNFSGNFNYSPYEGIRLGKELGQLVRFFGIGGVFHSDELPSYGIEAGDVEKIRKILKINEEDGFLIIAAPPAKINFAIDSIIKRIQDAKKGVPAETRQATADGQTVYLRPRPGASRMYPETDIPPILVTSEEISQAQMRIPRSWDESLKELQEKYDLNLQLAEQIFDSEYLNLFEKICRNKKISPNFAASVLCSTITNLARKGLDQSLLESEQILKAFEFLSKGSITKESMEIIFETIMQGKAKTIEEAIKKASLGGIDEKELDKILDSLVQKNLELIKSQGQRAIGTLMGDAMKTLRGKASGEKVNQLLKEKIKKFL